MTFQVSESISYLRPNSSYASILSTKSASSVAENDVVKLGIIELITEPSGTMLLRVTGPTPDSKFPTPPFAPSSTTSPILAHALSSELSVVDATSFPFRNLRVSGDVNLINAPGLTNFMLEVAKSPISNAPADVK